MKHPVQHTMADAAVFSGVERNSFGSLNPAMVLAATTGSFIEKQARH